MVNTKINFSSEDDFHELVSTDGDFTVDVEVDKTDDGAAMLRFIGDSMHVTIGEFSNQSLAEFGKKLVDSFGARNEK